MENQRKQYPPEFKLKVVLESLQRNTTLEAVRRKFGVSSSMIQRCRQEFQARAAEVFVDKRNPRHNAQANGFGGLSEAWWVSIPFLNTVLLGGIVGNFNWAFCIFEGRFNRTSQESVACLLNMI